MHYARGTPFNHLGHTTQLLCGQSALTTGQGSEHFLVAFYDKLSATAGLFFSLTPGTRTGITTGKRERWVDSGNIASGSGAKAPSPIEYYSSVL